jgi:D-glycero-D-manno-heptose 1,7-bisphosphate phosphatase
MNKVIFLDRDGVVNEERGEYTWRIEDFRITSGLVCFVRAVQERGFLVIIISNQGGIGRGIYSLEDVEKVHQYLRDELKKENLFLTDIYYCPHHPTTGKCLCRKPASVLLEKAIARYQADVKKSYFIGDSIRDVEAGEKVGLKCIKVTSNDDLCESLPFITD